MCSLEKRGGVYILTLTGSGEHRLSSDLLDSLHSNLELVRSDLSASALLTTSSGSNFFSNGFDITWAQSSATEPFRHRLGLLVAKFHSLLASLVSLPMPTIAALPGHAAAAGFMLALAHDYVFMRSDRGVLYMPEMDIKLPFQEFMAALIRAKMPSPTWRRDIVLGARKIRAEEAAQVGVIYKAEKDAEKTLTEAWKLAEELSTKGWDGRVYASIRAAMFPEIIDALGIVREDISKIGAKL